MDILREKIKDITSLKIQGATNVAKYGVELLKDFTKRNNNLSREELWKLVQEAKDIVYSSRATEPAMRNGLFYVINKLAIDRKKDKDVDIAEKVDLYAQEYLDILVESKKHITKIGTTRIPDKEGLTIMTHCHSSNVTGILLEAHKQGKKFRVICTETRPLHQGYITAHELTEAGIETTLVVDSAMRWAVRAYSADMILIGADAITSEGTVLNKIGSRLLALVAREMHIPYYVATPLLKFNPDTAYGTLEKIEMRDPDEIWKEKPENLTIVNPAFETVSRRYIDGLITEAGIFPATIVSHVFYDHYPFLKLEDVM